MRRFELVAGSSNKVWEVELNGARLRVRFGRLGTAGQPKDKTLGSAALAEKEADQLIAEKTKKSYTEGPSGKGAAAAAATSTQRPEESIAPQEAERSAGASRDELALIKASFSDVEESTCGELS